MLKTDFRRRFPVHIEGPHSLVVRVIVWGTDGSIIGGVHQRHKIGRFALGIWSGTLHK